MRLLKALAVTLVLLAAAAGLAQLTEPSRPGDIRPADDTVAEVEGVGVMCVGADPTGTWDRCAWRQEDGTWKVAEYPDGPDNPRWSCRTDAGDRCPHQPQLDDA